MQIVALWQSSQYEHIPEDRADHVSVNRISNPAQCKNVKYVALRQRKDGVPEAIHLLNVNYTSVLA